MKESSFYSDDFEQLIREKTEQYKMYPSEKVWKGVHNSLHTKRRWFIGTMALLVTGILFMAGRELIAPSAHATAARKSIKGAIADATAKPATVEFLPHAPLTAFRTHNTVRHNTTAGNQTPDDQDPAYKGISITLSNPVINASDLAEWLSHVVRLPEKAPDLAVIATRPAGPDAGKIPEDVIRTVVRPGAEASRETAEESRETADETDADARSVLESLSAHGSSSANGSGYGSTSRSDGTRNARLSGHLAQNKTHGNTVTADGLLPDDVASSAKASASAIAEEEDHQRINWLEDYAMNTLPMPAQRERTFLQLTLTPTINYRVMNGMNPDIEKSGPPTAGNFSVQPGDRMNNSPAFGFEFGGSILYRLTRNLSVKGGLQFNFARYKITAYTLAQQTQPAYTYFGAMLTLAANGAQQQPSAGATTVSALSLNNDYYQLSAPVGFELRVLGNERLQFNLGATVQPSYLLSSTAFVTSDQGMKYSRQPDQYRKWNISGALEAFLSYRVGNVRWQIGPEFRYQLLPTYTSPDGVTENLKSYGIKIGITKMLP